MENKITFNITKEDEGMKIKEFLKLKNNFSSRFCRASAFAKNIFANNKVIKLNYVLKAGDVIEVKLNKEESQDIEPENIPLKVAYEDSDIIVLNKPPFIVVHPTKNYPYGTLANGLLYYFKEKGENCIVRLVSRLDMNTSGLIIVAKNQFSHMSLQRDMNKEEFKKQYLAIVHGKMEADFGTIDLPIYKEEDEPIKRIIDDRGQRSITHYKVIETYSNAQLLKLTLETGRTHQIRVHLSHLGCPIFGDSLYGELEDQYIKRQALHAFSLSFPHPRDGRIINIEAELPADMSELLEKLRG